MQAIRGIYDNGQFMLEKKAPNMKSNVIVLFTGDELLKRMPVDEALRIFNKYTGSIDNDVNLENEKDAYFNEKYNTVD